MPIDLYYGLSKKTIAGKAGRRKYYPKNSSKKYTELVKVMYQRFENARDTAIRTKYSKNQANHSPAALAFENS